MKMRCNKTRVYSHQNGYSAMLYGKSSMSIINPEGVEVLHTGNRSVNTESKVMEMLGEFPFFEDLLTGNDFE